MCKLNYVEEPPNSLTTRLTKNFAKFFRPIVFLHEPPRYKRSRDKKDIWALAKFYEHIEQNRENPAFQQLLPRIPKLLGVGKNTIAMENLGQTVEEFLQDMRTPGTAVNRLITQTLSPEQIDDLFDKLEDETIRVARALGFSSLRHGDIKLDNLTIRVKIDVDGCLSVTVKMIDVDGMMAEALGQRRWRFLGE